MKKLILSFSILALVMGTLVLTGCGNKAKTPDGVYTEQLETTDEVTNHVQIALENGGIIRIALYPEVAPETVRNFQELVSAHFYDGIIFHRVISGFMIQGGDPTGTGMGGSAETIFGEFTSNGFTNNLPHERGVVSMARRNQDNNSASSQFFIMLADKDYLDGDYAAFGRVTAGMETVDWIAAQATDGNDKPLTDIVIKEIRFVAE